MKAGQGLEIDRDKYGIGQDEQNISFRVMSWGNKFELFMVVWWNYVRYQYKWSKKRKKMI